MAKCTPRALKSSPLDLNLALALGLELSPELATIACQVDRGGGLCGGRVPLVGTPEGPLPASGCTAGHGFAETVASIDERIDWILAEAVSPDPIEAFIGRLAIAARHHGIDPARFTAALQEAL